MEPRSTLWTPSTIEFERARLFLPLSTKLGRRIPNDKPGPQPDETMIFRRDYVLGKHPDLKVRSLSAEYNCVGMVFGARRTMIEPEHVEMILEDDGYEHLNSSNELTVGDIVVYKNGNDVGHVGIVVCVTTSDDPLTPDITVLSQWGQHGEFFHHIDDVLSDYGDRKEFWTDRNELARHAVAY